MTNPLDETLEALQKIQDAIDILKIRKNVRQKSKSCKTDKIISYFEDSASKLVNAVAIFQKHERAP